jgi:hypothetical protein
MMKGLPHLLPLPTYTASLGMLSLLLFSTTITALLLLNPKCLSQCEALASIKLP